MGCSAGSVDWCFHSIHAFAVEKGAHLLVEIHDVCEEPVIGDIVFRIERRTFARLYGIADVLQVLE